MRFNRDGANYHTMTCRDIFDGFNMKRRIIIRKNLISLDAYQIMLLCFQAQHTMLCCAHDGYSQSFIVWCTSLQSVANEHEVKRRQRRRFAVQVESEYTVNGSFYLDFV